MTREVVSWNPNTQHSPRPRLRPAARWATEEGKANILSTPRSILSALRVPIIAAPMAGGPTTAALVTAAAKAGGIGFLAAGYQSVDDLRSDIGAVRSAGTELFGVNLFITEYDDARSATTDVEIDGFARTLERIAMAAGLDGPAPASFTDNDYVGKIDYLCKNPVPLVSFTFGLPDADIVRRLHDVGTEIAIMVTTVNDARDARERGADILIAQGSEAGGHQSTFSIADEPIGLTTVDLTQVIRAELDDVPIVATGGVHSAVDARAALEAGADAVQLGTALLNTPEAGTSAPHRYGVKQHFDSKGESATQFTRGFSGRPARGVINRFILATQNAPAAYPYNNQMTKPLRASALSLDLKHGSEYVALWCGRSASHSKQAPSGFMEGIALEQVFAAIAPFGDKS